MLKEVELPKHIYHGIKPVVRDYPTPANLAVFGADTETCKGRAISLQICGPDNDEYFTYCDPATVWSEFVGWLLPRCRNKGVNLCYFHNLNFDARVLLCLHHRAIYEHGGSVTIPIPYKGTPLEVSVLFGKVNKLRIQHGETVLQVLDSKAFTQNSLARSLKMFGIPQDKLGSPEGLGSLNYAELSKKDPRRISFEAYAVQDARAERALALKILEFHQAYSIPPQISLPSYAARVFRRHFLQLGERIPFPPLPVVKAGELSYHGGKNGYYLPKPSIVEDLYELDISSAYPYAMTELPALTDGSYKRVDRFRPKLAGLYCISGSTDPSRGYPLIFDHVFKPVSGSFTDLWHTSYEVELILKARHVRITNLWGYAWHPKRGAHNPFLRYIRHFYEKKSSVPKTDPYYNLYKLCMNSLYGKLASTIEMTSPESEAESDKLRELGVVLPEGIRVDQRFDPVLGRTVQIAKRWRAGSLYNPVVGSWITGHTRAYLARLEQKYHAIHSATDSIKTQMRGGSKDGLGGLKVECFGRAYMFRNKLYLHCSKSGEHCGHKSPPFKYPLLLSNGLPHPKSGQPLADHDGQHLCKVAMHGYKGPLWKLWDARHELVKTGRMSYTYTHVVGLREGLKRGKTPCDFIEVSEVLRLDRPALYDAESDILAPGPDE
jgi:hypothetical protein